MTGTTSFCMKMTMAEVRRVFRLQVEKQLLGFPSVVLLCLITRYNTSWFKIRMTLKLATNVFTLNNNDTKRTNQCFVKYILVRWIISMTWKIQSPIE